MINSLAPYADVWVVGANTFGKPVGQIGIPFCEDRILRPTSFRTKNAAGFSDYFDGLPVDCPATGVLRARGRGLRIARRPGRRDVPNHAFRAEQSSKECDLPPASGQTRTRKRNQNDVDRLLRA